ncbi:MAG: aromatic-ring-hydroxylating dioxygenase [Rhodospirillaceae bacterium]|nr:aromatic-ring-hydroxylating dioxygenase [Rhodospirillaceae bacterium]|tara:strand:- start:6466 stop:7047 length:582 start_codon:yes stop_codon:yes gene_type:complete
MQHDPSRTSYYVGDDFYQSLVDSYSDWQTDDSEITDPELRDICRRLLEKEARLLEQNRLDDWLTLYVPECVYWVPATPHGGDPRTEIAVCFDDRRRVEDRIFRLKNEFAWSQQPQSRTARLVSNVSAFATGDDNILMVRSTFLTTEFQAGDKRTYTGWYGHKFEFQEGDWKIIVKQVNLIDCDQNLRNLSIIL